MRIYKLNEYNITSSGTETIDLVSNDVMGDMIVETVYIQVNSNCSVAVTGKIVDNDATDNNLAVVSMADLKVKESISAAGLYVVDVSGLSSIKIAVTGTSKIIVKAIC